MKFSESWLREWVNPEISREELMSQLTMAGLEVDGVEDVAGSFSGVVVGEVRVQKTLTVQSPDGGSSFHLIGLDERLLFTSETEALEKAESELKALLQTLASEAGAVDPAVEIEIEIRAPEIDGSRHFVEAKLAGSAVGKPKIKRD